MMRRLGALVVVVSMLLLGGCATMATSGPPKTAAQKSDPWEKWNRKVYAFNDKVDVAVLKPVANTYVKVVPQPVRRSVSNFFGNFSDAWSAVNNFLQGKFTNGFQDVVRVGTNSLFGIAGIFDVASEFGLDRQGEDFGQTLGRWGMGPGPYVVWPLLGSSTFRDSLALPVDIQATPVTFIHEEAVKYALAGTQLVDKRAGLLNAGALLDDIALDRYVFVRDAYLQRRRSLVFDGDPPETKNSDYDDSPPAAALMPAAALLPAASAASQAAQ